MGGYYPELVKHAAHLAGVTTAEEERFFETIAGGLERMAALTSVSGEEAFKLYDTYGFPIDLTEIVAAERGLSVDVAGFEKLLDQQRERSRKARGTPGRSSSSAVPDAKRGVPRAEGTGGGGERAREDRERTGGRGKGAADGRAASDADAWTPVGKRGHQKFVGYDTTRAETDILAFRRTEDGVGLILHENPFYAESGGQVSDVGEVRGEGWVLPVADVRKVDGGTAVFGRRPR